MTIEISKNYMVRNIVEHSDECEYEYDFEGNIIYVKNNSKHYTVNFIYNDSGECIESVLADNCTGFLWKYIYEDSRTKVIPPFGENFYIESEEV